MKKILFVTLALIATNTMFAKEKCCKGKKECTKEASANGKACAKGEGKACCKKGEHHEGAMSSPGQGEMHACCKKALAEGKPACCKKGGEKMENSKKMENQTK